jgi:hypothetical protein
MTSFDNLIGKKSVDTVDTNIDIDNDDNLLAENANESQADLDTPKYNSSENEKSLKGNCSDRNENNKSNVHLRLEQWKVHQIISLTDTLSFYPICLHNDVIKKGKDWFIRFCYFVLSGHAI